MHLLCGLWLLRSNPIRSRLGGATRLMVLDNMREGVLNRTYMIQRSIRSIATCSPIWRDRDVTPES